MTFHVDTDHAMPPGPGFFPVKPIAGMEAIRRWITDRRTGQTIRLVVVGGGAAAVEAAAALRRVTDDTGHDARILLLAGRSLIPGFGQRMERVVRRALTELDIDLLPGDPVTGVGPDGVTTSRGRHRADLVVAATGVVPPRLFADSHLPTGPDGSLAVNEHLNALGYPDIFGAGDCVWYTPHPVPRAGVFAVRQSRVLLRNVMARLNGSARRASFSPRSGYLLLLNMCDGTAVFWRRFVGLTIVFRSRWAWRLKDRIDRAFMDRYGSDAVRSARAGTDQ